MFSFRNKFLLIFLGKKFQGSLESKLSRYQGILISSFSYQTGIDIQYLRKNFCTSVVLVLGSRLIFQWYEEENIFTPGNENGDDIELVQGWYYLKSLLVVSSRPVLAEGWHCQIGTVLDMSVDTRRTPIYQTNPGSNQHFTSAAACELVVAIGQFLTVKKGKNKLIKFLQRCVQRCHCELLMLLLCSQSAGGNWSGRGQTLHTARQYYNFQLYIKQRKSFGNVGLVAFYNQEATQYLVWEFSQ